MEITTGELVEKYGTMVSSLAHRMILNNIIACEAAQEVWIEVIKSLPGFKGESFNQSNQ